MKKVYVFISAVMLIVACHTNPITGRKSLALISNSSLFPQSFAAYNQALGQSEVETGTDDAKMLNRVGERIKYAAERFYADNGIAQQLEGYDWEFTLLKEDQVNAWAMPGGKVAFYKGILPICETETGVAVVMGHEVGHALAGHGAERVSQGLLAQGIQLGANVAISDDQWRNSFNRFYPIGATVGILAYGRKQELDADRTGLYLMAMAGYDPREAVPFWGRMEKASEGQQRPPQFLSTHPSPEKRRADLNKFMDQAMAYYNNSPYKGQ